MSGEDGAERLWRGAVEWNRIMVRVIRLLEDERHRLAVEGVDHFVEDEVEGFIEWAKAEANAAGDVARRAKGGTVFEVVDPERPTLGSRPTTCLGDEGQGERRH